MNIEESKDTIKTALQEAFYDRDNLLQNLLCRLEFLYREAEQRAMIERQCVLYREEVTKMELKLTNLRSAVLGLLE